jgi:hypothetical protein
MTQPLIEVPLLGIILALTNIAIIMAGAIAIIVIGIIGVAQMEEGSAVVAHLHSAVVAVVVHPVEEPAVAVVHVEGGTKCRFPYLKIQVHAI